MRRFALFSLALAVGAWPLAAQFEGTIVMKGSAGNGKAQMMTWYLRRGQLAMSMPLNQMDANATGEFRMVIDAAQHTSTMLIPMTPEMAKGMGGMAANVKGMKMVMSTDSMTLSKEGNDVTVTKVGTSETIAGLSCDDYVITGKDKKGATRACITDKLGDFIYPRSPMGGRSAPPAWTKAFGGKAAFPLKVTDTDGTVEMEAVSVTRGPVPASEFVIPDDYMDLSGMMGRMGGRGGH